MNDEHDDEGPEPKGPRRGKRLVGKEAEFLIARFGRKQTQALLNMEKAPEDSAPKKKRGAQTKIVPTKETLVRAPKIIAGLHRSRRLTFVPGQGVRPATHFVRGAVFSWLASRLNFGGSGSQCCAGLRVLDAYAGTGAFGFEALSRGAAHTTFVDGNRTVLGWVLETARILKLETQIQTVQAALPAFPPSVVGPFDLAFVTPPYAQDLARPTLHALAPLLAPGAWIVVETDERDRTFAKHPDLEHADQRLLGPACVTFFRRPS